MNLQLSLRKTVKEVFRPVPLLIGILQQPVNNFLILEISNSKLGLLNCREKLED